MNENAPRHISQKFDEELSNLTRQMLQMGGLVERQVGDAIRALECADTGLADNVIAQEAQIDQLELDIDGECARVIALRQPTASDLRLILATSRIVRDLERIGDESEKIAQMAKLLCADDGGTGGGTTEARHIGKGILQLLREMLDACTRRDTEAAVTIARHRALDDDLCSLTRELVTLMMENPKCITRVLNILWAVRSMERISDHVGNIAEQLIYTVHGVDVRHTPSEAMHKQLGDRK